MKRDERNSQPIINSKDDRPSAKPAIAPSPKSKKEMMIITTLAPTQDSQSTNENSVTCLRLSYQKAKIDYSILEQRIRNTPLNWLRHPTICNKQTKNPNLSKRFGGINFNKVTSL
ncbi:hypothetical protein [Nostoc sp. MG11]|uniref:hypothetical protein n=1 Tax=Nostoc sp. MG11 TaxID=2721166 RepID=UPI0018683121|nr:hypothetical protein [Nostoc sp. MG11]